jgi:hypothetical protein
MDGCALELRSPSTVTGLGGPDFYFKLLYLVLVGFSSLWSLYAYDHERNELLETNYSANRSYSPRDRSPRRRSVSPAPARGRSYSKSPPHNRGRDDSPDAKG